MDKKIENGICFCCSKPQIPNCQRCIDCWFRNVSIVHFKTSKYKKILEDLAESQNYKCVYTDELLIPGTNMSLDHIISKFDDPSKTNDINNVQWVTKDVNVVKSKLSHIPFVELCGYIYKKFGNE
jgi:hypothetical protein